MTGILRGGNRVPQVSSLRQGLNCIDPEDEPLVSSQLCVQLPQARFSGRNTVAPVARLGMRGRSNPTARFSGRKNSHYKPADGYRTLRLSNSTLHPAPLAFNRFHDRQTPIATLEATATHTVRRTRHRDSSTNSETHLRTKCDDDGPPGSGCIGPLPPVATD